MKNWQLWMILSAVYLAPNMTRKGRNLLGWTLMAATLVSVAMEALR